MAETVTNRGAYRILNGGMASMDLRIAVILGTQTGVHNKDLNTLSELDAVSGVSFHTERLALTGEAITEDDTDDRAELDSGNPSFAAAPGVTAQGIALFDEPGSSPTDATRDLIAIYTTGFPQPMDGGLNVTITDLLRAVPQSA